MSTHKLIHKLGTTASSINAMAPERQKKSKKKQSDHGGDRDYSEALHREGGVVDVDSAKGEG
jgi:hypothetical protein